MAAERPDSLGAYEILGVLQEDAPATIYKARKAGGKRTVALKVLSAEFAGDANRFERFERDLDLLATLNSPHLLRVYERGQEGDEQFVAMELFRGTSLEKVLRDRRLSLAEAVRVIKGVSKGLQAAHRKDVVHRHLSPANVFVSDNLANVKVTDFGMSAAASITQETGTLATSDVNMGAFHYLAPEQARDAASADSRSDVYSAGVLFYEMLTGRVPVGRFNLPSQLNSEVPPDVDPVLLRCLEARPGDRFPSISAFLSELERLERDLRLGLVREVQGISTSTSKILTGSTYGRMLRRGLLAGGVLITLGVAIYAGRSVLKAPPDSASAVAPPDTEGQAAAQAPVQAAPEKAPGTQETGAPPPAPETSAPVEASRPRAVESPPERRSTAPEPARASTGAEENTDAAPVGEPDAEADLSAAEVDASAAALAEDMNVARDKLEARLYPQAQQDLEALIERNPKAESIQEAFLLLGRAHEGQENYDQARATYVELASRFGQSEAVAEAKYRTARLLRRQGGNDDLLAARNALSELSSVYAGSSWAAKALLERSEIERQEDWEVQDRQLGKRVPAALATYRQLVSQYPGRAGVEDAWWRLGEMYVELKEFALAAETFAALGERHSQTRHDAWWRAGQLYDRRLDDADKAVAAYERVPEASKRYAEAQRRAGKLRKK